MENETPTESTTRPAPAEYIKAWLKVQSRKGGLSRTPAKVRAAVKNAVIARRALRAKRAKLKRRAAAARAARALKKKETTK